MALTFIPHYITTQSDDRLSNRNHSYKSSRKKHRRKNLHNLEQVYLKELKKSQSIKRFEKLDFIKILTSCFSKNTTKKMKRHVTDWEKIFTIQMSDKELKLSRI